MKVFDYVKPVAFISRILQIAPNMNDGDIVLDFFSGSATTAHAVMKWNVETESHYKYIMIQLPEELDSSKTSQKVTKDFLKNCGRKGTLDEVGQERIIRVARKLKEKYPVITSDIGFKHYILSEVSQTTLDKIEKFDDSGFITDTTVYDEFGTATVLTTWLVHDNYGFVNNCKTVELEGYTAYWCKNHLYLINPGLTEEAIKALVDRYNTEGEFNPQNVVLFGYNFNYVELENLKTNVKILRDSEKNLKINLNIRY